MTRTHRVASIPGDGIGPEVVDVARSAVDLLAQQEGFGIDWIDFDWGSEFYRRYGRMMPESGLDELAETDAIFFGAVGAPDISDAVTLWGLLIPIRREFGQYVNLRPAKHVDGLVGPAQEPRRHRPHHRARELRRRVLRARRSLRAWNTPGVCKPGCGVFTPRNRAHHHLRRPSRSQAQRTHHQRDQIERHHPLDDVLGRSRQ